MRVGQSSAYIRKWRSRANSHLERIPLYNVLWHVLHRVLQVKGVPMAELREFGAVVKRDAVHLIAECQAGCIVGDVL